MSEIVVVGSINMDLVAHAPRIPRVGETILGDRFDQIPGGKGANQAVAAARVGSRVAMVGRLGDDPYGTDLRSTLTRVGVDCSQVTTTAGISSGVALIGVSGAGENSIIVVPGANGKVSAADVENAGDLIRRAKVLLVQLEIPLDTVRRAMELARAAGVRVILDPAPAPAQSLPQAFLALADVVTPNEAETEALTQVRVDSLEGAKQAAAVLCRSSRAAIVKLGGRGVLVAQNGQFTHIPAFPVSVVDTTAAGDAFAGGLAAGLLRGDDLIAAARYGNAVAALSTTRQGAQPAMPTRDEVEELLRQAGA